MEGIFNTNDVFDFSKLALSKPILITGGNYFIHFSINGSKLYIQPPKCVTKQGFLKSGKRFYTDLMFTKENESFIHWIENLEIYCQKFIYNNREQWFDGEMELHDIENYFTPLIKLYKSGKFFSIRINVNSVLGKPNFKIYDEDENILDIENINDKTNIMTIIEITGIKCSSRSFQIELELKQLMVLKPENLFDKLLLKPNMRKTNDDNEETANKNIREDRNITNDDNNLLKNSEEYKGEEYNQKRISMLDGDEKELWNSIIEKDLEEKEKHTITLQEKETKNNYTKQNQKNNELEEIDFNLEEIEENDLVRIKERNEVYYNMYKKAIKKAKIAREFALSSYLEAKNIKNTYMLDDINDSDDSDLEFNK
jgi:hypothetical protein